MVYEELLLDALRKSVVYGDFVLHSGQSSNWKCDVVQATSTRSTFNAVGALLMEGRATPDLIVGPDHGGHHIALACMMARPSRVQRIAYTKDGHLHGSPPRDGDSILLVDDVLTTGSSLYECGEIVGEQGVQVGISGVAVVLNRSDPPVTFPNLTYCYSAGDLSPVT